MGDVIHNLPVVSDIHLHFPAAEIDWVVEESFAAIPALHPGVRRVIPVAVRRWRKSLFAPATRQEIKAFKERLQRQRYDFVIDTQGLVKSAIIARLARGRRCGYDWQSAWEALASLCYEQAYCVAEDLPAIERNRRLTAQCLGYSLSNPMDYGIRAPAIELPWLPFHTPPCPPHLPPGQRMNSYAVLLHSTSRADKLWSEANWVALGQHLSRAGMVCVLPWGTPQEKDRSERLARQIAGAIVPPRLDLNQAAAMLAGAKVVVGVDSGLTHLAAALRVPVVGIYCASEPGLTGVLTTGKGVSLGSVGQPPSVGEVIEALEA